MGLRRLICLVLGHKYELTSRVLGISLRRCSRCLKLEPGSHDIRI